MAAKSASFRSPRFGTGWSKGALKLVLEPIFEADFQPGSFGYRPKKSAHDAVTRVSEAIIKGKTHVIDLDLRSYFDTVRHHIVLKKVAKRVNDDDVMHLAQADTESLREAWRTPGWRDLSAAQQHLPQ